MYTAKKRIVVNGRLAAYEGEVMEDEEAIRRGIVKKKQTGKAKATAKGKKAAEAEEPAEEPTEEPVEPEEAAEAEEAGEE